MVRPARLEGLVLGQIRRVNVGAVYWWVIGLGPAGSRGLFSNRLTYYSRWSYLGRLAAGFSVWVYLEPIEQLLHFEIILLGYEQEYLVEPIVKYSSIILFSN